EGTLGESSREESIVKADCMADAPKPSGPGFRRDDDDPQDSWMRPLFPIARCFERSGTDYLARGAWPCYFRRISIARPAVGSSNTHSSKRGRRQTSGLRLAPTGSFGMRSRLRSSRPFALASWYASTA